MSSAQQRFTPRCLKMKMCSSNQDIGERSKLCTYNFANIDMVKYVSKQECIPVGCVPAAH